MNNKGYKTGEGLWKGASAESFSKAKFLRKNMPEAEKMLWEKLRNNQVDGKKFRRQHPIGFFIVDFYCHSASLVIEIDGEYHLSEVQKKSDDERTQYLMANGLKVIRFTNEEVENSLSEVLEKIILNIKTSQS